ncbi:MULTISPECIES: hypothetical protein [unclassified Streptomyces]|uniref:hypothetical protein n=1 Tax=unclassified Streptomyces TaxID=2593676 RepID=UPI002023FB64|nr:MULTISPECIES: hypothetical protein [unclassified Streptomyces]MCX4550550.1 hypothetical protein [Streptomyces sp. NBC_01500]WSC21997.1 hypothetical protein OIE60_21215 [Streptomyces sp. NBC_01766]
MTQITDQTTPVVDESTARLLRAVADHFTKINPAEVLEQDSLLISFGAEAYRLTDRKLGGAAQAMATAALAVAPELPDEITRGEYALRLHRLVVASGHDWPDDDNDPVIPRITGIPGQRTATSTDVETVEAH